MSDLVCCTCTNTDNEIDILDSGPNSFLCEEEQEQVEDDEFDCHKMKLSMLCMRSVIDKYQLKLKSILPVCPDELCIDFETELTCSKNKEICELQRSQHKLHCQIMELVACCKVAKTELKNLHSLTCKKSEEILALQKHSAALESWRRTLELEAGLCIERFEFLKNVKAEWSDVVDMLEKDKKCFAKVEQRLVPQKCYVRDKKYFMTEIAKLKQMFRELYELQHTQFNFGLGSDTPLRGSDLKLAEKEYMSLKTKFNDLKYGKDDEEKKECE